MLPWQMLCYKPYPLFILSLLFLLPSYPSILPPLTCTPRLTRPSGTSAARDPCCSPSAASRSFAFATAHLRYRAVKQSGVSKDGRCARYMGTSLSFMGHKKQEVVPMRPAACTPAPPPPHHKLPPHSLTQAPPLLKRPATPTLTLRPAACVPAAR